VAVHRQAQYALWRISAYPVGARCVIGTNFLAHSVAFLDDLLALHHTRTVEMTCLIIGKLAQNETIHSSMVEITPVIGLMSLFGFVRRPLGVQLR
jgi:hypothetical protein